MVGNFQLQMSQNVAPLTKIVALFGKKNWGVFWRLLALKRAVSDSELLHTLVLLLITLEIQKSRLQNGEIFFIC